MRVTIGDLDYYYAAERRDMFNTDAMKISSYHKQKGDQINFVLKEDDIRRPYDLYYVIKENSDTPNPPMDFFTNRKVKWWGSAVKPRVKGDMSDEMLSCRPDYLLYPEKNTKTERSEQVRLFNNKGKLLRSIQNGSNTFKNKYVLIVDGNMWFSSRVELLTALNYLKEFEHISFKEPIWLGRILKDKELKQAFFALKFTPGSNLSGTPIRLEDAQVGFNFIEDFKEHYPAVSAGVLKINYCRSDSNHGLDKNSAFNDFKLLKKTIIEAKNRRILVEIQGPAKRLDTPFFMLFEACARGTSEEANLFNKTSGLDFITLFYGKISKNKTDYGNDPSAGNEVFRDLLRQTGMSKEFLLIIGGEKSTSINEIPGMLGKNEFILKI